MSEWAAPQLRLYDINDNQLLDHDRIIEAAGGTAWHEIGGEQFVVVPWTSNADFGAYANDRRVYITVVNTVANTTHVICDFIIEGCAVEERKLDNGEGQTKVLRVSGRDRIKTLAETPSLLRHISKYRQPAQNPTAVTETTIQMHATDTAAFPEGTFVGWTVELENGDWSEVVAHTAGGLLTIDPAWQTNVDDEEAPAPSPQRYWLYGAALTETTGSYTDLKLAFRGLAGNKYGWGLDPQGYDSTVTGSFVDTNDASILKALQQIAAQTGEYFVRTPGTKRVRWRREVPPATHPQYGNMILLSVPFTHTPESIWYAHILPGQRLIRDTTERVTRVKPTGGGSGDEMLTLRDLPDDFTPATGYPIDGEYLISIAAESAGPQEIGKELRFPAIAGASDNEESRQLAAQALYRAALYWLREHDEPRYILECEVQTSIPIPSVTQVAVNLGGLTTEGNPTYIGMFVLESTPQMKTDGSVTYRLKLSDKKAPILTDERLIANAIRDIDTQIFTYNAPQRNSRKLERKGGGGGESDHPAATSGSAAIGVSPEQVISFNLAGPSGMLIAPTGLMLADSVAGLGLNIINKILNVALPANSGLVAGDNSLALGTPGTLTAATTNAVSGSGHTHAVTTTANAWANPNTILQGDANGMFGGRYIWAETLDASARVKTPLIRTDSGNITIDPASNLAIINGNLRFTGARIISSDTGSLTLAPASSLIIDPSDDVVKINPDVTLKTAHWASGFLGTGWGLTYDGVFDARKIQADELHVAAFIADVSRVKVGADFIPQSRGTLSRNFVIPAVGTTQLLYVEDLPGLEGMGVFAAGDWVLLRVIDRPTGGLFVYNVWGQVTGYVDLPDGEQRWTFTTRLAPVLAVGNEARRGLEVLDFGKSGDGWIHLTSIDPTGSPHIGISTWQGDNPYTSGNITHWLRLGQLRGVTGVHEHGLWAGSGLSSAVRFSNLNNEIHGSRLSLYAGDGARLQVSAVQVLHWRTAGLNSTLNPDADHSSQGVFTSGGNYYSMVDEGTGSPNHADYIANANNAAGFVFLGLSNPTWGGSTHQVQVRAALRGTGFATDTARLYAQVFASDELTPLTAERNIRTQTDNTTNTVTVTLPQHVATATQAQWNGARLRLRWEYDINANKEALRLDPNVPSLAVGEPLPTGYLTGGAGFWTGRLSNGSYALRIGHPVGPSLRYSGTNVLMTNGNGNIVLNFDSSGNALIDGVLSLGTGGGIYQGTGTFASPTSGLKIWRDGNIGRIATYSGGTMQVGFDTTGKLVSGNGLVTIQNTGIELRAQGSSTDVIRFISNVDQRNYGGLYTSTETSYNTVALIGKGSGAQTGRLGIFAYNSLNRVLVDLTAGNTSLVLDSAETHVRLSNADLHIREGALAVGYPTIIPIGRGVIASDLAGEHDNPHLVLQDSGDVAHGMTDVASTSTYANLRKSRAGEGGLQINGLTESGTLALDLWGYINGPGSTTAATGSLGAITLSAAKRSGTGVTALASNENVLIVSNNGSAGFIVKGNGNFHYDGTGAAFDDHDDVGLLRTLARSAWNGTIDSVWDKFVTTNRRNLIDAGVMSEAGFINGAALNRLLTGAIWQLNERLSALEEKLA